MISKIAWNKVMAVICSTALVGTAMCGLKKEVSYVEGATTQFDGDQGTLPWDGEFQTNETENNGDEGTFPWYEEFTTTAVVTTKGNGDNWGEDIFTTSHQETTTETEKTTAPETTEKEVTTPEETKETESATTPEETKETESTTTPEETEETESLSVQESTEVHNDTTKNDSNVQTTTANGASTVAITTVKIETTIDVADAYTAESQVTPVIKKAIKKKSAKKATIKLKKVVGVNGYQVKVSINKKFKKKTTVTVASKKVKVIVKKLKAGKKYFVKARTYTIIDGKKVYGKWSKVKKIKNK